MSDNDRKLRSGGSTTAVSLDKTKNYKMDKDGSLVIATTVGENDIIFSGSKSSLRRIADLERNISILAAKVSTTDGAVTDAEDQSTANIFTEAARFKSSVKFDGAVTASAGVTGSLSGNASTATVLQTARTIGGVSFNGSANITLPGVNTAGTQSTSGNAATATKLATARTIALGGDLSGSVSFDGSGNVTIIGVVTDDSHAHAFANITGKPTTLAGYGISDAMTTSAVTSAIATAKAELTNGAGAAFDTLKEIQDAMATDAELASAISGLVIGNGTQTVTAGAGMTGGGSFTANQTGASSVTLSHADTSAVANVTASGRTYVTGLTFDTYGHVVGTTVGTETVVNTDTNTTYTAGAGLTLTGTTFSLTDISSQASLTALTGASVISDIDVDSFGRVTSMATRTMTLANLGYTGATNANYITNTNQLTNGAGFVTSSGVTSVATGNGLTGGTITSTGTLALSGSYTGNYAISGTLNSGALTVSGAITSTGEVTAYYSDKNLKKDIVEITDPIAKVMSLRGVTFRPNDAALALGIVDKEEVGVIAQEVEAVLPQLVVPSAFEGYKTVKYDKLTALLLEAIKAQQLQIDALTAQIAKLGGSSATKEL